jgi:hypothetical protein
MIAVAAFAAGAIASALLWRALGSVAGNPQVQRANTGVHLPVGAGIVIVLAVILVGACYQAVVRVGGLDDDEVFRGARARRRNGGVGLIGLLDDLVGATATKGFAVISASSPEEG